jgi:hypothetical protein
LNLEENFIKCRDITLNIIEIVKKEEYEKLEEIVKQRQLILDDIKIIKASKEELKKMYLQYNIDKLEKELTLEMKERRECLLQKIKGSQRRKVAVNGYNSFQAKAVFLSREF